ncbi:hypothetical protein FHS55_001606 [Angulomicrobium tetraedrale]|uniref:Oligosaccharide repeat unit polymerase n=1 Tax=Ancylobacter tetraedralis TaxID=217068 RepID=A0A839Z7E5_9HYPH|nr:hypothetical protein [Ancylobacter tetraedralis]MBB3771011.1 hypothetical protein [Ancylobacter tetraedralis]
MLFYLILFVELIMLAELMVRIRLLTSAHLILMYIILSQIVFWSADWLGYEELVDGLPSSFLYFTTEGVLFYFAFFILFYLSTVGIKIKNITKIVDDIRNSINSARSIQYYIFIFCVSFIIIDFIAIDKDVLWKNYRYLFIGGGESLIYSNPITRIAHSTTPILAIVSVFGFFSNLFGRNFRWAMLWFVPALWMVAYATASASRLSAMLMFVPIVLGIVMLRRGRLLVGIVFGLAAVMELGAALWGRGNLEFGISAIPTMLGGALSEGLDLSDYSLNLFQGIFVTSDSLMIGGNFSDRYSLLSMSPFPSFIDGFNNILESDQIRLHLFVPMSALAEVILFGWPYAVVFFGIFAYTVRLSIRLSRKNGVLYILFTPYVFLLFVIANAYPTRNVFRQLVYVLILSVIASLFVGWLGRRKQAAPGGLRRR